MLQTIEGIYENGQIIFKEKPPKKENVKVFITFTEEKINTQKPSERRFGTMKGSFKMSNDFNDELEDFQDYK